MNRGESGLRGPVRTCTETTTYPSTAATTEWTSEFDSAGRLTATIVHNPDGSEFETRRFYNGAGLLLKATSGMKGGTPTEVVNHYDSSGKIQSTTSSASAQDIATYSYDGQGRKTKIQTSRPEDYRSNVASAGSPFGAADRAPNLPGGGSATTYYDEHDRPYKVEVRDDEGTLVTRALRSYDEKGNVADETQVLDDPVAIIPAQARARILQGSGATTEELRAELTKFLGGCTGPYSVKYERDDQGRVIRMVRQIFNTEESIESSYNEHGDLARELTHSQGGVAGEGYDSEASYSYQYDANGNWTEKIVSYRNAPDSSFTISSKANRQLTYY